MRRPLPVLLGLVLVACAAKREPEAPAAEPTQTEAPGAMPMEAPSPTAAPEAPAEDYDGKDELHADLSTLEKAEAELARAQTVLDGLYVAEGRGVEQAPKKSAAPRAAAPPAGGVRTEEAEEKAKDDRSRCDTACRAFASLERAADAVCRLAGDAKDRCARAKKLVDENGGRVASCSCRR
jgi:hypothetical protein